MALYISASASDGNCQVIDHSINPPEYADSQAGERIIISLRIL